MARERTILVTGFLPFAGEARNPSGEIASAARGISVDGARVESVVLPVVRERAWWQARDALERLRPEGVLALGLAVDRPVVNVERVAVNLDDYEQPDEGGSRPRAEPIVPEGPDAWFATVDVEAIASAIRSAGVPAGLSHSAGTFLCNHVFYRFLHEAASRPESERFVVGFLHLPPLPETVAARGDRRPSMALETSRRAVDAALAAVVAVRSGSPRAR